MSSDLLTSLLLAVVLLACSLGLMVWHLRAWRGAQTEQLDPSEFKYRRNQFRRRLQTSAMLGLIAVLLPIGVLVMWPWPYVGVIFWGVVLLLVVWVCLLAGADVLATSQHYGRLQNRVVLEEARIQAEIYRARANGKPDPKKEPAGEEQSDSP